MASALTLPASLLSLVQFQVTEVCDGSAPLRLHNFQCCGLDWVSDAKKQKDRSQSSTWESCKWFNYLLSVWSFTHYQRTPPAPENKKFYFSFWSFSCQNSLVCSLFHSKTNFQLHLISKEFNVKCALFIKHTPLNKDHTLPLLNLAPCKQLILSSAQVLPKSNTRVLIQMNLFPLKCCI